MRKLMFIMLVTFMLFILAACGGNEDTESNNDETTESSELEEIELRLGLVVGDWSPHSVGADVWKELLAEESGGKINLELFLDGTLGGEREMMEAVQAGNLDIAITGSPTYPNFEPKTSVLDIPYLVSTFDQAEELMDGPVGDQLSELMLAVDLRVIGWGHNDFRIISNNQNSIEKPEDLAGVKMRVPENEVLTDWFQNQGSLVEQLPTHEIYTGLQQGVVDGQDNGPIITYAGKYFEHQDYVTVSNHAYSPAGFFISEKVWNTLSSEAQEIVERTGKQAVEAERKAIREFNEEAINSMEEAGLEVIRLDEEGLETFKQTREATLEVVRSLAGDELTDFVLEEAAKIIE